MPQETLPSNKVSFAVAEVEPGKERLPEIAVRPALERTARTKLLTWCNPHQMLVEGGDFHPLIAAAAIAYQRHYPLALSPDMIWLTILQGVAQHVSNHSESLRSRLVAHQTKIELVVDSGLTGLPQNDAEMVAVTNRFVDAVSKHVPPNKHFLLRTEFSTTTELERIAGSVVLMDTFQPYFDYVMMIICGIPSVTLEGTTADWELLAAKTRLLHESDLELSWWTRHLLPLCEQFVRASSGDVERAHWMNLCKLVERYGVDDMNGWLLKFIPYIRKDKNELPVHRNPVLELTHYEEPTKDPSRFKITGCTSNMLPTGISRVPVTVQNLSSGDTTSVQFLAGLVGVSQSVEDLSVRPVVGWAIADASAGIDALVTQLRTEQDCRKPSGVEVRSMIRALDGHLPGDMWKFYSEIECAWLRYPEPNQYGETDCHIYGYENVRPVCATRSATKELKSLPAQGEISANCEAERSAFYRTYGSSRIIARAGVGRREVAYYVFGVLPESEARIFRWNGQLVPTGFKPVANSFTEWLASVLEAASPTSR